MVNVVIARIIVCEELQWVKRQRVSAVIIDGLHRRYAEEGQSLSRAHARNQVGDAGAESVEDEAFHWMIIECAVCVRYIQSMMPGMQGRYNDQPLSPSVEPQNSL